MKNSKEYSKKISALHNSLKRKHAKVEPVEFPTVVDSLIYGIISEKLTEKETEAALKRFDGYFVDFNDLRVSRVEEIAELLGEDTPENREVALSITKVLNRIYTENQQVTLEGIHKLGKRPARQKFEKMEELSRFAVDYCMLTALASHAIPLNENMVEYLKANDLVDEQADAATIEGFLAKQIPAKNGYEFYKLLRHESETNLKKTKAARKESKTSTKSAGTKAKATTARAKKKAAAGKEKTAKAEKTTITVKKVKKVKKETAAKTKKKK